MLISSSLMAQDSPIVPPASQNPFLFQPDFSGKSVFVPQGTNITPLCTDPSSPLCFSQWTNQAIPMASYTPNVSMPQYNYFLPAFIPSASPAVVQNPENDSDWEKIYIPSFSTSSSRGSRYSRDSGREKDQEEEVIEKDSEEKKPDEENESSVELPTRSFWKPKNPTENQKNTVRIVETDSEGKTTVQEGQISFINENHITNIPSQSPDSSTPALDKQNTNQTPSSKNEQNTNQTPSSKNEQNTNQTPSSKNEQNTNQTPFSRDEQNINQSSEVPVIPNYQISEDTYVLPSTTKEIEQGCFVIDKKETQTEAVFCIECYKNEAQNTNLLKNIKTLMNQMNQVKTATVTKVDGKLVSAHSVVDKICAPEKSLSNIISDFEKTCEPDNDFKKFFKHLYCKSCNRGVPPEIMLSMMSIESKGDCSGQRINLPNEASSGLFQVNAINEEDNTHQCTDYKTGKVYKSYSNEKLQCFKNPFNSFDSGLKVIEAKYRSVNGYKVSPGEKFCEKPTSEWLSMGLTQQDKWRKAVSAYNGGEGYVRKADKRINPNKSSSWEAIRIEFFYRKLIEGKGRRIDNTRLNIAHTEAVLGRNFKGASTSMVDVWSQYIQKNKVSCSN